MWRPTKAFLILLLFFGTGINRSQAEPLSLETGLLLAWDKVTDPSISPSLYLPVINNADPDTNGLQLIAFTYRLRVRPVLATGTLIIDLPSIDYADINGVIPPANQAPIAPDDSVLPAYIAFSGFDSVAGHFNDVFDGQNVAKLQFTTPDGAIGVFELVAVNDDTTDGTGWLDHNGAPQAFTNLPFENNAELVLGRIVVGPQLVPEPNSVLMACAGLIGFMAYGLRRFC